MLNHVDLMQALIEDYLNVFVVRPQEDTADVIRLRCHVSDEITENARDLPYSKLLRGYVEAFVCDEDKDYLLNALLPEHLLEKCSEGCGRLEMDYRAMENGEIHFYSVHLNRSSKPGEALSVVMAFRNIDYIAEVGYKQHEKGIASAYNAVSAMFFSMHRVDIQNNTYTTIKGTPTILRMSIPNTDNYDTNAKQVITNISSEWSRESALKFADRSTLEARMAGKNHISLDFLSYAMATCVLHFFKEDEDEFGHLKHVIFAVEMVNEEKSMAAIDALSREYQSVFMIDLGDASCRVLKQTNHKGVEVNVDRDQRYDYSKICGEYLLKRVHPEDAKLFADKISLESLREIFREQDELSGSYRTLVNGEVHHYRYSFFKLPNFDYVLAGYRNIDDIIARHVAEEEQQRKQELKHQRQREEQLAIFNTLARNFKNVYLLDLKKATVKVLKLEDEYADHRLDDVLYAEFHYEPYLNAWISEAVHPDDRESLKQTLSAAHLREVFASQKEYIGNYRMQLPDGRIATYQFSISLMQDGIHAIAGFQNIDAIIRTHLEEEAKRRKKEQAYQNQLEEQLMILNTLSRNFTIVYLADLANETLRILKIDKEYETILRVGEKREFPYGEFREYWLNHVVSAEDRERVAQEVETKNILEMFKTRDEFGGQYRSFVDGKTRHFQFHFYKVNEAGTKAVLGFQNVEDIVAAHLEQERKEREIEEERLRNQREHAEVISSLSTIYSTIFRAEIDTHHYEVLTTVPRMEQMAGTGGNFDDVKAEILEVFMAPEMQQMMSEFLDLNTLADRLKDVDTVGAEYKNRRGKWYQARFIVKRRDENGTAKEVLYVARNITSEKLHDLEQQDQLHHALLAAQQASKAKTTFLSSMSHDIRTPMNAIIGFTALAQTHMDDTKLVQEYLGKISTSSSHLLNLINDVLDMSRIESGTVKLDEKPIHIPELLHDLRTMVQGLVNSKKQNLYIDTQDVVHEDVITDRLRLNQVLLNIVSNAVKYTQAGGDIIIRLLEKPSTKKDYRTYVFYVKDNGRGMSEDFVDHIFETFSREQSSTVSGIQGTGLGMAITKNIVDLMGGTITVESQLGKGSLFTVTLDLRITADYVENEPIPELLGARVLVVDDDLNTCKSVCKMLRDIQMRPDWTLSGTEAVVRAQEAAEIKEEYKVYIVDYLMPGLDGIETVRRIRKVISEEIPIIVLTAYDWTDFADEAKEAGVTAFVSKPLFMSELRSVLTHPGEIKKMPEPEHKHYDYSGKRVLLVEDNELNREIAESILNNMGIEVDVAVDGLEAVDIMSAAKEDTYDLIFMDIQMPRMDGYTATREIRTLRNIKISNIPIVAMTANAFEEDRKKSFEAGMNGHIVKPINMDAIAHALDSIFGD